MTKQEEKGVYYEGRYPQQEESERAARLGAFFAGLGLTVGVPMVIWGIHLIDKGQGPWVALGSLAGAIVSEAIAVGILLRKT